MITTQEKTKRNKELIKLREQGKSYNYLAKYFNMSPQRVWNIIKRNEIKKLLTGGKV